MKFKRIAMPLVALFSIVSLTACDIEGFLDGLITNTDSSSKVSSKTIKQGFALYRSDTGEELKSGDTIEMETYYDFYFNLEYNGEQLKPTSIVSGDKKTVYPHGYSVYPRKEGTTSLTITYTSAQGSVTYDLTAKSKIHNDLVSIYVSNGADGIEILEDGTAKVTSKVFAVSENGFKKAITNDSELSVSIENGKDANHKKVTISYKGKSASYDVSTDKTNPINRTKLKQTFKTYADHWAYSGPATASPEGDIRILTIPVWFTDSSTYINENVEDVDGKNQKEQIIDDLEQAIYGDPVRKDNHTLKSYFLEESFGSMNVTGTVSDWYTTTYSTSYDFYRNSDTVRNLTEDACNWYFDTTGEDPSLYDEVIISYGSTHYGDSSNRYGGFKFSFNRSEFPTIRNGIFASVFEMYNVNLHSLEHYELSDLSDEYSNDALRPTTVLHEFAHTLGTIDIYNDQRVNGVENRPAGVMSLQADNCSGHDVYNLLGLGWAYPYVLSADQDYGSNSITLTINDLQSSGDCVILTPQWNNNDSPFDEYIVLELFAETSVNNYLVNPTNKSGIRVYHVDSRLWSRYDNEFTTDATTSNVLLPFTNTNGVANASSSIPQLSAYEDMDLVHLIRCNDQESFEYLTPDRGRENVWFKEKSSFSMSKYAKQFYTEGKLDTGEDLGWSFTVDSINVREDGSSKATITFTKQ